MGASLHTDDCMSSVAQNLWAKTGTGEYEHLWQPLYIHLADTAEVARLLWNKWLPEKTRRHMSELASSSIEDLETLVVWLAALHDIGKATPLFQAKVPQLAERVYEGGLSPCCKSGSVPHAALSEALLMEWLDTRGWNRMVSHGLASIVGGHHGSNPLEATVRQFWSELLGRDSESLGGVDWLKVQSEHMLWAAMGSGMLAAEESLKPVRLPTSVQVLITGLIIMADWIASNTSLFPLVEHIASWDGSRERAVVAWTELAMPKRLQLKNSQLHGESLFHARFGSIPKDAHLNSVQESVARLAEQVNVPTLCVVEAPMGSGKTEASLLFAESLLRTSAAGGLAYLLPTQATSNAMFGRVEDWLRTLLDSEASNSRQDLHLLHANAALNDDYASLPIWDGAWMGDGKEDSAEESVQVHQWFSGRKRGLLAPFVVGTVDQALMAALNTRHVHLRHLGLSCKVVVIDEVHAYDAYMSAYLDRVLLFLGGHGVSVILLSATLPPARRNELLQAYRGYNTAGRRLPESVNPPRDKAGMPTYPLVTHVANDKHAVPAFIMPQPEGRRTEVAIIEMADEEDDLVELLTLKLADGGCACVIRDTVSRAQRTYEVLRDRLGCDVRLTHSRFIAVDRSDNDARLVSLLGRDTRHRPQTLVVVATQVIEQSLDLDFDLLVSDAAPMDLLLQRMGRLHRHAQDKRERPKRLRTPTCYLTGVADWESEPPEFARGVDTVYQPMILWRTILALRRPPSKQGSIVLPHDIAPLVERVYEGLDPIPDSWTEAYEIAEQKWTLDRCEKVQAAKQWLLPPFPRNNLDGWTRNSVNVDEVRGKAAVRDLDESIEVVLVREVDGNLYLLPWVAERLAVPALLGGIDDCPTDEAARAAALSTVSLPPELAAPYRAKEVIRSLEKKGLFEGWQQSRWLAGLLALAVNERGEVVVETEGHVFLLRYTQDMGMEIVERRCK